MTVQMELDSQNTPHSWCHIFHSNVSKRCSNRLLSCPLKKRFASIEWGEETENLMGRGDQKLYYVNTNFCNL
jgi:hypothetical protein